MAISPTVADRLAAIFSGMKEVGLVDRDLHHQILRETLRANPKFLGVWAVWEPGALDARDGEYANTPGHDASGRFLPVWHRRLGDIRVEPNLDCEKPGIGAYYLLPTRARRAVVVGPYEYPMGGAWTLIATLAAPIMFDGECLGATGVDFSLEAVAGQVLQGQTERTMAMVAAIEQDLRRGLVFLDADDHVVACSAATQARLTHFLGHPLAERAELPEALRELLRDKRPAAGHRRRPPKRPEVTLSAYGRRLSVKFVRPPKPATPFLLLEESATCGETSLLSTREREVMDWLSEGKANDEIAIILGISPHTVKNHLDKIFKKLAVDNRHAASLLWHRERRFLQGA